MFKLWISTYGYFFPFVETILEMRGILECVTKVFRMKL